MGRIRVSFLQFIYTLIWAFMPGFQDALGNLRELLDQIKSKE
jgi:hypothetical protein